jgi:hypothetical protein
MTNTEAATLLHRKAALYPDKYISPGETDEKYKEAMFTDAADLERIADWIEEGDLATALRVARNLDTVVREEIPMKVWYHLNEGA